MKSAGKARNNGLYRHIRTSKEIIRNLLNDFYNNSFIFAKPDYFVKRSTILSLLYPSTIFVFCGRKKLAKTKKHPSLSC